MTAERERTQMEAVAAAKRLMDQAFVTAGDAAGRARVLEDWETILDALQMRYSPTTAESEGVCDPDCEAVNHDVHQPLWKREGAEVEAALAALADRLIDLPIPHPFADGDVIEVSGMYGWPDVQRLAAALAPLIAEHARAEAAQALREAADEIEVARNRHWQQHLADHPFADGKSCPGDYGKHDAYYDAIRIVRLRADTYAKGGEH